MHIYKSWAHESSILACQYTVRLCWALAGLLVDLAQVVTTIFLEVPFMLTAML